MEDKLYKFIEDQEGRKLHSYLDSAGVWTIGIGSTIYQNGKHVAANETITDAQANELLQWEVSNKMAAVRSLTGSVTLNDNQIIALVSLTYNIGIGALISSTLLKRVKANPNDKTGIRKAFNMWNKIRVNGKLKVSPGLAARRKREADLYFIL